MGFRTAQHALGSRKRSGPFTVSYPRYGTNLARARILAFSSSPNPDDHTPTSPLARRLQGDLHVLVVCASSLVSPPRQERQQILLPGLPEGQAVQGKPPLKGGEPRSLAGRDVGQR